jgi:hypothetical protein
MVNEAAEGDTLDPYFALILDIFYTGEIPGVPERAAAYGSDITALESAPGKDRFLIGEIPVHLEFKTTVKIDDFVSIAVSKLESLYLIKDSGTYGFYRLANSKILYNRSGWIHKIQNQLSSLGDEFWNTMRNAQQSRMEHSLSDLGAAFIEDDEFNCLISSSLFIKTACLTLFCINRRFEPSHRAYYNQVRNLPVLPESFAAQLETFVRAGETAHRYSIAKIIARGIVSLGIESLGIVSLDIAPPGAAPL